VAIPTKTPYRLSRLITLLFLTAGLAAPSVIAQDLRGSITVVGRGPERPVIEKLAQAFERTHLGTAIGIKWSRTYRLLEMVKAAQADLAVTGKEEPELSATTVAWDGLAVIVNFSNPVTGVTMQQAATLFTGAIRDWSELDDKAKGKIRLVVPTEDQNLADGFERSLGITGRLHEGAERSRSDQKILSRVSGQLDAVAYLSLEPALDAMTYGLSVRALLIDGIEPGKPTVRSGQYKLRRPIVFVTLNQPTPLTRAFVDFARSAEGQRLLEEMYVPFP
jgi:phosphate transport system substrate-binding protein